MKPGKSLNVLGTMEIRGISECAVGDKVILTLSNGDQHRGTLLEIGPYATHVWVQGFRMNPVYMSEHLDRDKSVVGGKMRFMSNYIRKIEVDTGDTVPTAGEQPDGERSECL